MTNWHYYKEVMICWIKRSDLTLLVGILFVVLGIWAFIEIADETVGEDSPKIDRALLLALRNADNPELPIGPSWMKEAARDVTAMGGFSVLLLVIAVVSGFLILTKKYHALLFVLVATSGGWILSTSLKSAFARPRPDLVPHLTVVHSMSFPSGHSMLSAVVYLTLGSLLARMVDDRRLKIYFIVVALLITLLVGFTRVYLGVHYPTDVLAGWAAGLVWAVSCWLIARHLQHKGAIEHFETVEENEE